jgi:A/G-specific adenine glycosylase
VWLVARPPQGMLGGMRALPDDGWSARANGHAAPPLAGEWRDLGAVRHTFTHAHLTLTVLGLASDTPPAGAGEWWPLDRLGEAGLPTLFAKAAQRAMAESKAGH